MIIFLTMLVCLSGLTRGQVPHHQPPVSQEGEKVNAINRALGNVFKQKRLNGIRSSKTMTFPFNLRESNPGPALTNQLPTTQEFNSEPRLPRLFELDIRDSTPGQKPQPPSNSLQEPTPPKFTPLSHQEESNFGSDVRLIPRGRLNPDAAAGGVKPSHQDTLNLDDNEGGFDPSHQERLKSDAAAGRFNPSRQDRLNSRFNPRTRFNQESHQDSHQRNQRPNQITKNETKEFGQKGCSDSYERCSPSTPFVLNPREDSTLSTRTSEDSRNSRTTENSRSFRTSVDSRSLNPSEVSRNSRNINSESLLNEINSINPRSEEQKSDLYSINLLIQDCISSRYENVCSTVYESKPVAFMTQICRIPMEKSCREDAVGDAVCRTLYEDVCKSIEQTSAVEEDFVECQTVLQKWCNPSVEGGRSECGEVPRRACSVNKRTVDKVTTVVRCSKEGKRRCEPLGCSFSPGVKICTRLREPLYQDFPKEHCQKKTRKECRFLNFLHNLNPRIKV